MDLGTGTGSSAHCIEALTSAVLQACASPVTAFLNDWLACLVQAFVGGVERCLYHRCEARRSPRRAPIDHPSERALTWTRHQSLDPLSVRMSAIAQRRVRPRSARPAAKHEQVPRTVQILHDFVPEIALKTTHIRPDRPRHLDAVLVPIRRERRLPNRVHALFRLPLLINGHEVDDNGLSRSSKVKDRDTWQAVCDADHDQWRSMGATLRAPA